MSLRNLSAWIYLIGCGVASVFAQDAPRYEARFDSRTSTLSVRLCLKRAHAQIKFAADSGSAMRYLSAMRREGDRKLDKNDDGWSAADWHAGECLSYSADLGAIADTHKQDVGWRLGTDLVTAPQLWLLRPDTQGDADAQITLTLADGFAISAPWRALEHNGNKYHFRIPNTPANWSASVAIGEFREQRVVLPGGTLRVTILHGASAAQEQQLRAWLAHISQAVLSAYGRLPLDDVQVMLIPMNGRGDAVSFGQSTRGQGNALQLLVDPGRPESEFADDWTAVHELSHLMHPYLGDRGSWLAEGLASYYQNVLRARSGLLTPAQAWDRLATGFRRGAADRNNATLADVATNMHQLHAYMRVYWAGAAYWLTVDRDLRRTSNGTLNLETALSRFRDCCLPAHREWQPEDFVARLDALLGSHVFVPRYQEFAAMSQFPDWEDLYKSLGIDASHEQLQFNDNAPDAAIREMIMRMPPKISAAK